MGARFATPQLTVLMDDGAELTVRALNIDMLKWDRERAKRHWPKGEDAPFVWMTFLAWSALQREQLIPTCTLDEFEQRCWSVTSDVDGDDAADPTPPAAGGG